MKLPPNSVRGRIRAFIERHAGNLGADVLEVGSRMTSKDAWWIVNRDLAQGQWTGIDMQPGAGVDVVANLHELPGEWGDRFSGILCSEVFEHVEYPRRAAQELFRVLRPGGSMVLTTLFAFPEHGFPDDFFRYSRSGLQSILIAAGFKSVHTEYAGEITVILDDHGNAPVTKKIPMHTFAVARKE